MSRIKSIVYTALILITLFSTVAYTACNKKKYTYIDPCEGIECRNNGVCISGECDCTAGYSGANCEKKNITPYLGNWSVSQRRVATNNLPVSDQNTTYSMQVTEDNQGVTFLNYSGLSGESAFDVTARIGMEIGVIAFGVDSIVIETDVVSTPNNFIFIRNQPLGSTTKQLLKGEGNINSLGTQMSGEFWVVYPDSVSGAVTDKFTFTASYIN